MLEAFQMTRHADVSVRLKALSWLEVAERTAFPERRQTDAWERAVEEERGPFWPHKDFLPLSVVEKAFWARRHTDAIAVAER